MEIPISLAQLKNAAAILLLFVFLFNVAGYRLFFFYAESHADQSFTSRIDKGQYESASLVTVSVPLHMPYISDQGFQRADGQITLNGQLYKYVSRAVRNDSLILQCLPDLSKTAIAEARSSYGSQLSDNQLPGKKLPAAARKFVPDNDYDLIRASHGEIAGPTAGPGLFLPFEESVPGSPCLSRPQPPDLVFVA